MGAIITSADKGEMFFKTLMEQVKQIHKKIEHLVECFQRFKAYLYKLAHE